jgi:signal recognition particle subunit SRP72
MPPKPLSAKASHASSKTPSTKRRLQKQQPAPITDRLKRLFTSLCAQVDGGHFTNAIRTCNKILRLDSSDRDALRTKLFLLLQTEQYDTALALIAEINDQCPFERAYALYRLQREEDAGQVLKEIKNDGKEPEQRGAMHLEAQLSYRQGSYRSALDIYNELLETADPSSDEHADILTNLSASQSHQDFITTTFMQAMSRLPSSIASTLESAPPPVLSQPATIFVSVEEPTKKPEAVETKKKLRAKRVPKGVIPGVSPPPDPERWLKKSERTSYTQGKKRRGPGGGATQGATVGAESGPVSAGTSHGGKTGGKGKGGKKK